MTIIVLVIVRALIITIKKGTKNCIKKKSQANNSERNLEICLDQQSTCPAKSIVNVIIKNEKKQQQKTCVKKTDCESQTSSALPFSLVKYC